MKKIFFPALAAIALLLAACNNNPKTETEAKDNINKDTVHPAMTMDDSDIDTVAIRYPAIDAIAAASIKKIIDAYLAVKNALVNDKASEAANGAKAMQGYFAKLDKSLLTAEQKSLYDRIEESLQVHAEYIGKNGNNIKQQREHFALMSGDVYNLAKVFGGGRELYHDHCPMYNENKGAMWLSETKEVKNPYLGAEMPTCGTVEEVIR
ncbi:MAG: hypothetical protein JWP81_3377 [Ferruginibacter sp.]|nr:hypothetical protein [Ferruginibacter sp.]